MFLVYSFRRILRVKAIALQSEETWREIFSAGCPERLHSIHVSEFSQDKELLTKPSAICSRKENPRRLKRFCSRLKKFLSETVTVPVGTKIDPV
jgi:hypothetical protein